MHRSRSREKPRAGFDLATNAVGKPVDSEGHIQPRNCNKASRIELDSNFSCDPPSVANSITFDFKGSSSKKKAKAPPLRAPLAEEMPIEKQTRRPSPTVIARLMGLDTLPSPPSPKPRKEVNSCSQKLSSKDSQEKLAGHGRLLKKCSDARREFKDVFEVEEVPKVENQVKPDVRRRRPDAKHGETGMAFIRQSFINAKRLSTDEMLQRSKEFDNALEVLESNKDLFLKLLQEPHSLFSKYFQDLSYSPRSPHASHALIQRSSRESLTAACESSLRSEIKDERSIDLQISGSKPLKKPAANSNGHPFREPMYVEEGEDHDHQPTQIVILKPSLAKPRKVERTVRSVKSWDKRRYGVINHGELLKEERTELYQEERGRLKLGTMENSRLRKKHTTELPKDAQQEIWNTLASGRRVSMPKYSNYVHDDDLWPAPSISDGINSLTSYCASDNVYEHGKSFSPSSSSSIQSSEQWRLNHHQIGLSMRASNTLGEMLALSDNETFNRAQDTSVVKKACPFSISSKDGWKDGFARNLPRSKSLPASSLVHGSWNHNPRNRFVGSKSRFMPGNVHSMSTGTFVDEDLVKPKNSPPKSLPDHRSKRRSDGKGNRFPSREIRVSSEEFKHKSYVVPLAKEKHTACNLSDTHSAGAVEILSVPSSDIVVPSLLTKDKMLEKLCKAPRSERNGKHSERGFSDMLSKQEDELLPSYSTRSVPVSPDSYKEEEDQPSPVSVLELSSKDDESASGCFEKISTDLQDLRMQLRFLKSDPTDGCSADEIEAFISCHEDSGEPVHQSGGMLQAFRDEEDRDYSFLLDMLIDSGAIKSEKIELFGACRLAELPVSADVFTELEKKYKSVASWPRSERKFLFDLINHAMADISAVLFMNVCPWGQPKMAYEGLVEKIWQAVARRREEVSTSSYSEEESLIGTRWFDIANDSEVIGRELENMLSEHLMDQLVTELIHLYVD